MFTSITHNTLKDQFILGSFPKILFVNLFTLSTLTSILCFISLNVPSVINNYKINVETKTLFNILQTSSGCVFTNSLNISKEVHL